jgi:O-antigen/teichoic acid export membrane protein
METEAGEKGPPGVNDKLSPGVSLVRGVSALVTTQPITWMSSLALAALLPTFLGDQMLGQYSVASSVAVLVGTFSSFGIPRHLARRVAANPREAATEAPASVILVSCLSLLCAVSVTLALPRIGMLSSAGHLLLLILLGMAIGRANGLVSTVLLARERYGRMAWLNAVGVAVGTLAGLLLLALGGDLLAYVFTTSIVVSLGQLVVSWRLSGLRLHAAAFNPRLWWRLVQAGLPFMGWRVLRLYSQVDTMILAWLSSEAAIGWYAAAQRIAGVSIFVPTLITTPLLPVLSRHAQDRQLVKRTLHQSIVAVLLVQVPISSLIVGVAPRIPGVLGWPSSFGPAVPLMMLCSLAMPLIGVNMLLATVLAAMNHEKRWLPVGLAAAILNPSANLVLIPIFENVFHNGPIGASIVSLLTEIFLLVGTVAAVPSDVLSRETARVSLRIVVAGLASAAATFTLQPISLLLAAACGGMVFLGTASALRVVSAADLRTFISLARKASGDGLRRRTTVAARGV